jgi:hypothetical protein
MSTNQRVGREFLLGDRRRWKIQGVLPRLTVSQLPFLLLVQFLSQCVPFRGPAWL